MVEFNSARRFCQVALRELFWSEDRGAGTITPPAGWPCFFLDFPPGGRHQIDLTIHLQEVSAASAWRGGGLFFFCQLVALGRPRAAERPGPAVLALLVAPPSWP